MKIYISNFFNILNQVVTWEKLNNIQKCVKWCEKNRINYNKNYQTTNIFLGERGRNNKM